MKRTQLEPGEEVIAGVKGHWIVLGVPIAIYVAGWVLSLIIFYIGQMLKNSSIIAVFVAFVLAFFVLFSSHHLFFLTLLRYLLSITVITNKRLIVVNFSPLVQDDVTYIELEKIQSIHKKEHGFYANLLNYGEVTLDTVTFHNLRNPIKFISFVESLKNKKPLMEGDLKQMGVICSPDYLYLAK